LLGVAVEAEVVAVLAVFEGTIGVCCKEAEAIPVSVMAPLVPEELDTESVGRQRKKGTP